MLAHCPELVLPKSDWGSGKSFSFRIPALSEEWAWMERQWSRATVDTGVGDPAEATAETGARITTVLREKIGQFLFDLSKADPEDLYARG
jgi:creatinine amidohydrolase